MPELLADRLAEERALAIRALLRTPLLHTAGDPDTFRLVVRHRQLLTDWFETSCGWQLTVDPSAGFARLAKRPGGDLDPPRPPRRPRGQRKAPLDRRRYQLLCLCCAELVRHPVTTIGLLARGVGRDAGLDVARRGERSALVDALLLLIGWGVLRNADAEVEGFVDDGTANAILTADTTVLHQLLSSELAPSALESELSDQAATELDSITDRLLSEPRYGRAASDPGTAEEQQRLRFLRHRLARRLLDDPVLHLDDLSAAERDYLSQPSGRRWLRERIAEAGMVVEERSEGWLVVDPSATATDLIFPAPSGNAYQLALLLIDKMIAHADGERRLVPLAGYQLHTEVAAVLRRFPGWAASHREGDGPQRLADQAADLLVGFGLCRRADDQGLIPRPALARYRVGAPRQLGSQQELFDLG